MKTKTSGPKVKCLNCNDIIQSQHVHDWVCCSCFKNEVDNRGIYVDGGSEYLRIGGPLDGYQILTKEGDL